MLQNHWNILKLIIDLQLLKLWFIAIAQKVINLNRRFVKNIPVWAVLSFRILWFIYLNLYDWFPDVLLATVVSLKNKSINDYANVGLMYSRYQLKIWHWFNSPLHIISLSFFSGSFCPVQIYYFCLYHSLEIVKNLLILL